MPGLTETARWWTNIFRKEITTPVEGGTPTFDGNDEPTAAWSNAQAQQLADRTLYLKNTITSHASLANPHSATREATGGRLVLRDAAGRAKMAAPSASDDIAIKSTVDTHAGVAATDAVAAHIRSATQAEINAGSAVNAAVRPDRMRLGFTFVAATTGYISFPTWLGGFILQWGPINALDGADQTTAYPITFPTACLQIMVCGDYTPGSGAGVIFSAANTSTASFVSRASTGVSGRYFAVGH